MSYLVLLPCLLFVFTTVKRHGYPAVSFTVGTALLALIIVSTGLMATGADVLLATSLSMCVFHIAMWYWGPAGSEYNDSPDSTDQPAVAKLKPFCARGTHDFALPSADTDFAMELLKAEKWSELADSLAMLDDAERQGFYANFDYSKLVRSASDAIHHSDEVTHSASVNSLIKFTNEQPHCANAHVLYAHSQLCEAKRLGLRPGQIQNADSAAALAIAFRHFRLALRLEPNNAEALCGLILAKGFTGLSDEHIEQSLQKLLDIAPLHFHGLVAAACFLVNSTAGANRFVSIVERTVGENNITAAFARIVAHVECMLGVDANPSVRSRMIVDLHAQLRVYHKESAMLGQWQQGIGNNIVAFAFERIGDNKESALYLEKVKGMLSPYPWQRTQSLAADESVEIARSSTSV